MSAIPPPAPTWIHQETASYGTMLERVPLELSGAIIAQMFERAKTESDIREAEALWLKYKDKAIDYEKRLDCSSYGTAGDKDIAVSIVEDISNRPLSLMIAIGNSS